MKAILIEWIEPLAKGVKKPPQRIDIPEGIKPDKDTVREYLTNAYNYRAGVFLLVE